MVRPSMMGTLAPQKKEAAFSTQEERPSFWAAVPTQAWEGFHANGKSCGPRSFWGAGEQSLRARTPPGAQRTSPDDPAKVRRVREPAAAQQGEARARTQGPGAVDIRRTGSFLFDRLAEISQASRVFKHTQGLNYSESSAETTRIKERKADRAIK